jgi:sec-independent protein translocase protein TatA
MDVGAPELLIILVVALLIFGPKQLPKLSRSLGQAAREFRHGTLSGDADAQAGSGVGGHDAGPQVGDPPPVA